MFFHHPGALLWAALAIPIAVLYLFRHRTRRVTVATMMFWDPVFEQQHTALLPQRLRHLVSLLFQLALLALLVLALADPEFSSGSRHPRQSIIVLDCSASMQAIDSGSGQSRFDMAIDRIRGQIQGLRTGDRLAIIAAGAQPRIACGLSDHAGILMQSLADIRCQDGPSDMSAALDSAEAISVEHPAHETIVLTDGCLPESILPNRQVSWKIMGSPETNVAITQFQVRRNLLDPENCQLMVTVTNASDHTAELELDLLRDQHVQLDVIPLKLPPGESKTEFHDLRLPEGGLLTGRLNMTKKTFSGPGDSASEAPPRDALELDNQAAALLPPLRTVNVHLVTNGNLFLQRALEAGPVVRLQVSSELPKLPLPKPEILVLHRHVPDRIPDGPVIVIDPESATDLWSYQGQLENPLVAEQDAASDLMKHVHLQNVLMPEARHLSPLQPCRVLATSLIGAPLYFRVPRTSGDVLVLSVNLDRGDLPLRTAFPILLANALSWFSEDRGRISPAVAAGTAPVIPLISSLRTDDDNNRSLTLTSPHGSTRTVAVERGAAVTGVLDQQGIWKLSPEETADTANPTPNSTDPTAAQMIVCNVTNAQESDLRFPIAPEQAAVTQTEARIGPPLWQWLALAGLILLVTEWLLFHRRWID
ncbi:MAG: BatA and WFA domain-containing protein [Planctomycetaceae bacterium]